MKLGRLFKEPDGDISQGLDVDEKAKNRNYTITFIVLIILAIMSSLAYRYFGAKEEVVVEQTEEIKGFGEIIESEFVDEDNQSAVTILQLENDELNRQIANQNKIIEDMQLNISRFKDDMTNKQRGFETKVNTRVDNLKNAQFDEVRKIAEETALQNIPDMPEVTEINENIVTADGYVQKSAVLKSNTQGFGIQGLPPRPRSSNSVDNSNQGQYAYDPSASRAFDQGGIDQFTFEWDHVTEAEQEAKKRTIDNYMPTGGFVTAVVTGGADADAGALGQGNTAPMVFQTINEGILPNGQKSKLKDCTITGSVYGEISSSRGIVRTNRISCIFADDEILDIPIKGTVFNFGRNGIRGTTILKNGKIVQMAGVAGILTGLGETGKALSETTSTSALGSTSTINSQDAALNLLGNATSSVGEKLADYYIKLADLYHPIVELNPGNIVNIVFLAGFPLDSSDSEAYEAQVIAKDAAQASLTGQILNVVTNNPLAGDVSNTIPNFPQNMGNGGQSSPFGQ
ncbi:TrbI/VirB10 family protein [Vibrio sonorensis]|uniref:TrbI/VirB10 family protein n=1 Tax=Vibrio sonorensis TaxID=1004316 RepID=UPI0008D933AB|nr:TrbI/VirB10 family protein [Vibrio sonorensis]